MISFQRREELRQLLLQNKAVTINEAAALFNVSDETIRRDINYLCSEGFCTKIYGGATLTLRATSTTSSFDKKNLLIQEKQAIAKKAAEQIKPHDCIFLDHSTTVLALCQEIKQMSLTVATNSLWVIDALNSSTTIKLIATGGTISSIDQGMFGMEALNFIEQHFFDKAFFSCRSLNLNRGMFDAAEHTASVRRLLLQHCEKSYLLADHTKLGLPSFIGIDSYRSLHTLITDAPLSAKWVDALRQCDVEILESDVQG